MTQRYRVLVNGETLDYCGQPITLEVVEEDESLIVGNVEDLAERYSFAAPISTVTAHLCAKHMDAPFVDVSCQCVKCLEDEIHRLRVALQQYADEANWRIAYTQTRFETTEVRYYWDNETVKNPCRIAEEALK